MIAMLSLILITLVGCNIMKEQQKRHLIEIMQQDEDLGLYEEIKLEDVFNDGKRENIKKFIDEINNSPEPNQALKDAAEKYAEIYRCPATNSDEYCRHDIISAINFGIKLQQEQDRWKTVFEETPPSNIELLAESPDGVIHLTDWRAGYQIFSCQAKSESSDDWKWKII